jgi:amidase
MFRRFPDFHNTSAVANISTHRSFGISFLGGKFTESTLIGLAYAFEQKTLVRDKIQPYIIPSTELGDMVGF